MERRSTREIDPTEIRYGKVAVDTQDLESHTMHWKQT